MRTALISFSSAVAVLVCASFPESSVVWDRGENETGSHGVPQYASTAKMVPSLSGRSTEVDLIPAVGGRAPDKIQATSQLSYASELGYLTCTVVLSLVVVQLICAFLYRYCNGPRRRSGKAQDLGDGGPAFSSAVHRRESYQKRSSCSIESFPSQTLTRKSALVPSVLSWGDVSAESVGEGGLSSSENSADENSTSSFPGSHRSRKSSSSCKDSAGPSARTVSFDLILWDDSVLVIDQFPIPTAKPLNLLALLQDRIVDASGTPKHRQRLLHCGQAVQSDEDLERILAANASANKIKLFLLVNRASFTPSCEEHPGNPVELYCPVCQVQLCSLCGILHFNATQHMVAELTDEGGVIC
jgi:hypothetical protein